MNPVSPQCSHLRTAFVWPLCTTAATALVCYSRRKMCTVHREGLRLLSFSGHSPNLSTVSLLQLPFITSRFLVFGIRVTIWPLNPQQSPGAQVEGNQSWRCSWFWLTHWKEATWPACGDVCRGGLAFNKMAPKGKRKFKPQTSFFAVAT